MKTCKLCGREYKDEVEQCGDCQWPLPASPNVKPRPPELPYERTLVIVAVLVVVASFGLASLLSIGQAWVGRHHPLLRDYAHEWLKTAALGLSLAACGLLAGWGLRGNNPRAYCLAGVTLIFTIGGWVAVVMRALHGPPLLLRVLLSAAPALGCLGWYVIKRLGVASSSGLLFARKRRASTEEDAYRQFEAACWMEKQGRLANAIKIYREICALFPESEVARDAERSLQSLQERTK